MRKFRKFLEYRYLRKYEVSYFRESCYGNYGADLHVITNFCVIIAQYASPRTVYVRVHDAGSCPCCMSMSMMNVHIHATCPSPCCALRSILHVHAHAHASCRFMFMSMLHVHVHDACSYPCCLSMPMVHVHIHGTRTYPCPCCTLKSILHACPCPCPCPCFISMLHVHVHFFVHAA